MPRKNKKASDRSALSSASKTIAVNSPPWIHMGLLLLTCLAWHGFILTNDGTIWDSWYVKNWLQNKNWSALNEFFGSVGMPIYGWLYSLFAYAPHIVEAFMFATVACMAVIGIFTYFLARKLADLDASEAFCLALLAQAMPVFTAGQDFIMFFFVFMHALFLGAACLATKSLEVKGRKSLFLRVISLVLFFFSFYNAALLVFYGGFFILFYFKWLRKNRSHFLTSSLIFSSRYPDFLLLPPLAWGLRQLLTPQFGWYADYNSPTANLPFILPSIHSFVVNVIPFHARQLGDFITEHPSVALPVVVVVFLTALRGSKSWMVERGNIRTIAMAGFGFLLLFFAIFPFAAAGKGFSPQPIGEPSRYTILTALPFAILIFAGLRLVFLPKPGHSSRWITPICAGLAVLLGCQIPPVYVAERAEWIFSRSILHNAKKNEDIRGSSIIVLQNCGMTSEIVYGIYAFASTFGDFTRLVTPTAPQNRRFFTPPEILLTLQRTTNLPNMLNRVNPAGRQSFVLTKRNREGFSDFNIVLEYLKIKYLYGNSEMSDFLSALTTLQVERLKDATPLLPGLKETATQATSSQSITNMAGIEMLPVSEGCWVAKTETTQEQYAQIMGSNPSLFVDPMRPVERVSWNDAMEFCRRLTLLEKNNKRLPEGMTYRLPSLAEAEMIASDTPLHDAILAGENLYWQTQPTRSLRPNSLGLYDTVGNVWEWTSDWGDKSGKMKISTGGGFANFPAELSPHPQRHQAMDFFSRAIVRRLFGPTRTDYPDQAFWDRGFRCVLAKENPGK